MKRILVFSLVYYPRFIGGAEVALKEITDRIPGSDFEFDMVTLRLDRKLPRFERIGNVNVYRVGFSGKCEASADSLTFPLKLNKYLLPFLGAWKASSLHRDRPYDGTWAMMANYSGFAALFFKLLHPRVPYLLSLQEGDPIDYIKKRVGLLLPLFRRVFTKADLIQTISYYLAGFAREMGYEGPIKVVPNAVAVDHFSQKYSESEIAELKDRLGKKYYDVFLVTTSRLVVKNAVGDIVRALLHLPTHVKLIVLGTGYQDTELRDLVHQNGLSDRVQFLGYISHAEMPKYLHASDIFIRPALSEGFGNSFIEAMAAGIPVIATPVGGIVDFLTPPETATAAKRATGIFCKVSDPQSIADAVMKLLDQPALREMLVSNARSMVIERYDWNLIAPQMEEVMQQLVKTSTR